MHADLTFTLRNREVGSLTKEFVKKGLRVSFTRLFVLDCVEPY